MQFAKYTILFMRHTANIMNIYHSFIIFIPQFYCHSAGFPFFYYLIRGELKDKTGRLTEGRRKRWKRSVGRQWGEEILITTVRRANLSITSSGRREPPRPWIDIVRWENICIIFKLLHQQNYLKILFQKEIFCFLRSIASYYSSGHYDADLPTHQAQLHGRGQPVGHLWQVQYSTVQYSTVHYSTD